jgi:hypothetical protein
MATWFTVVGRIALTEGIADSLYKNALVEFDEGDTAGIETTSWRSFYVAFWGDLLETGRSYVIFGTGRLTSNEECSQPKVSIFIYSTLYNWKLIGYLVYRHPCHTFAFGRLTFPLSTYLRSSGT